jgi:Family of unknown function (DUF5647)
MSRNFPSLNLAFTFAVQELKGSLALVSLRLREGADGMKRDSVIKKNLDLLDEFMKYAFDHPDILEEFPPRSITDNFTGRRPYLRAAKPKDFATAEGSGRRSSSDKTQGHETQGFQDRLICKLQLRPSSPSIS